MHGSVLVASGRGLVPHCRETAQQQQAKPLPHHQPHTHPQSFASTGHRHSSPSECRAPSFHLLREMEASLKKFLVMVGLYPTALLRTGRPHWKPLAARPRACRCRTEGQPGCPRAHRHIRRGGLLRQHRPGVPHERPARGGLSHHQMRALLHRHHSLGQHGHLFLLLCQRAQHARGSQHGVDGGVSCCGVASCRHGLHPLRAAEGHRGVDMD